MINTVQSRTFITADLHFSHTKILQLSRENGERLRPYEDVSEMDEALISNWNSIVADDDRVLILGDLALKEEGIKLTERLNGSKYLIKGNHDIYKLFNYVPYFKDVLAYYEYRTLRNGRHVKVLLSHMPVHPYCFENGRYHFNFHGHLHDKRVMIEGVNPTPDPRYKCVSVEHTNYTPIDIEQVVDDAISFLINGYNRLTRKNNYV